MALLNPKLADGASEEVETILDREIELRIFRPENQTNKAGIMYYHGGGFVMCHVKMYRKFLTNLGKITLLTRPQITVTVQQTIQDRLYFA